MPDNRDFLHEYAKNPQVQQAARAAPPCVLYTGNAVPDNLLSIKDDNRADRRGRAL
jgi:hypothetical protein